MSELKDPTQVKYFFSVLFKTDQFDSEKVKSILASEFSDLETFVPEFNPLIDYYTKEMGDNLNRVIFYSKELRNREDLIPLKKWTTDLEKKYSNDNKRLVNLDIGYIAKEQVILATGKPYSHRVYLGEGIFAELTYFFQEKTFKSLPWTYPDYAHAEKIQFFNSIR